jgi:hypothetical protein
MKAKWKSMVCAAALAMAPASAVAQDDAPEEGLQVGNGILSLSGGLGLTIAGLVTVAVATPFLILSTTGDALTSSAGGEQTAQLEEYLRSHEVELRQDTALGSGQTVDELAAAFGVGEGAAERAAFGRVMRGRRARLLELARPEELTPERAKAFIVVVVEGMAAEPALAR